MGSYLANLDNDTLPMRSVPYDMPYSKANLHYCRQYYHAFRLFHEEDENTLSDRAWDWKQAVQDITRLKGFGWVTL